MLAEPLYPLRFRPILKELIWGGRRLSTVRMTNMLRDLDDRLQR